MNATATRDLAAILADIDSTQPGTWAARSLQNELEIAVRRQLAPLPEGEAERMAAETDRIARTMAPPVPGVTVNVGYTVRAVFEHQTAGNGWLESWHVAAERASDGHWVTWEAYKMDGRQAGFLAYNAGHYYDGPDPAANRHRALAGLAVRAGLMREIALLTASEVTRYHPEHGPWNLVQKRERQLAGALRTWAAGGLPDGGV